MKYKMNVDMENTKILVIFSLILLFTGLFILSSHPISAGISNGDGDGCTSDSECPGCQGCASGTCFDDDSQCSGCQVCNSGSCEDDDSQCSGCQVCNSGSCEDDDSQCSGCQVCNSGTCVDDDSQCSGCKECNSGSCVDDDSQCDSYCDTDGGTCEYCKGGDVWVSYNYCHGVCDYGECHCNYDFSSCGDEEETDCDSKDGCYDCTYKDYECSEGDSSCSASCEVSSTGSDSDGDGCDDKCDEYDNDPCSQEKKKDNCNSDDCEKGSPDYCDVCDHCGDGAVNCGEDCEDDNDCCDDDGVCPANESCHRTFEDECNSNNNKLIEKVEGSSDCEDLWYCSGPNTVLGGSADRKKNQMYVYDYDEADCSGCDCYGPEVDCSVSDTVEHCARGVCGAECHGGSHCTGELSCEGDCMCEENNGAPVVSFKPGQKSWTNTDPENFEVTVELSDNAGISKYRYRWCRSGDEHCGWGSWQSVSGTPLSFTTSPNTNENYDWTEGELYLWVQAKDEVGELAEKKSPGSYNIDTSGPNFLKLKEKASSDPFDSGGEYTGVKYESFGGGPATTDEWVSSMGIEVWSHDPYALSELNELNFNFEDQLYGDSYSLSWDDREDDERIIGTETITQSGEWELTAETNDNAGNSESFSVSPYRIDNEEPQVSIDYESAGAESKYVTRNRDVRFTANASDDYSGVRRIEIHMSHDDNYISPGTGQPTYVGHCDYEDEHDAGDTKNSATCTAVADSSRIGELDEIHYKAFAWDNTDSVDGEPHTGNMNSDRDKFVVCGFYEETAEIGNSIVADTTCEEGKRIRGDDCQDGQKAGMTIEGAGMCPPLHFQVDAYSNVNIDEGDIDHDIILGGERPVIDECGAYFGASGDKVMDGIHGKNLDADETPTTLYGGASMVEETWNVGDIPYYCRGEVLNAESYKIYEHEDLDDSSISDPANGELVSSGGAGGQITLDPTMKRLEFGVPEEENIKTGFWDYVFPMEVKNWNDRPVMLRTSWRPEEDILAGDTAWEYEFVREYEREGYGDVVGTSHDDLGYDYLRKAEDDYGNLDLQLKLGARSSDKNFEDFALMVNAPPETRAGPYLSEVGITRDENDLEP